MVRFALLIALSSGCISKAKEAVIGPEPEGGGTLSCKEIVEQCDAECSDPLCLHRCTPQGTEEARVQHDALLQCGQNHGCTGQACMEQNCSPEITACLGPMEEAPDEAPDEAPNAPLDAPPDEPGESGGPAEPEGAGEPQAPVTGGEQESS